MHYFDGKDEKKRNVSTMRREVSTKLSFPLRYNMFAPSVRQETPSLAEEGQGAGKSDTFRPLGTKSPPRFYEKSRIFPKLFVQPYKITNFW